MKKALISTLEPREHFDGSKGFRVAQVELAENIFEVGEGLHWVDCEDIVIQDEFYFDTTTNSIVPVPIQQQQAIMVEQAKTNGLASV